MKISLRRANALQLLINEQINEPFVGSVTVGRYDNPVAVIEAAGAQISDTVGKKLNLIDLLYVIRRKVGEASFKSGVSDLLTDLAYNEKRSAFFRQLASTKKFAPAIEQVIQIFDDLKAEAKAATRTYMTKDSLEVSLLAKETVDIFAKMLVTLRREKQTISDKLLHLNVSTEIELDEQEVVLLKKFDIL